jgi:hypothetical protein
MPRILELKECILHPDDFIWGAIGIDYPHFYMEISNKLPLILQVYTIYHEFGHLLIDGFCNNSNRAHELHDHIDFLLTGWLTPFVRKKYLKN